MTESQILNQIRLHVGRNHAIWRNETGVATHNGRRLRYGLCRGSSDLIGIRTYVIQPEDAGRSVGIFTAAEVKTEVGRATQEQLLFLEAVRKRGGLAALVRSVDEATQLFEGPIW